MGKNAKINHSKPEHLGVVKFNFHMWNGYTEVSKKVYPAMTTGGAITSGQTNTAAPLTPFSKKI